MAVTGATVQSCTSFTVDVDPSTLPLGAIEVAVTNPDPAGCDFTSNALFRIDPVPTLASVEPSGVCANSGALTLTMTGTGFETIDGADFAVTVGGVAAVPTIDPTSCTSVTVPGHDVQVCTSFTVDVDPSTFPVGPVDVTVTNPGTDACTTSDATLFSVSPAPAIASLTPDAECTVGAGQTSVTATGTGFLVVDGTQFTVSVGGTTTAATPGGCAAVTVPGATNAQSCNSFTVTFDASTLAPGPVDITVTNPPLPGCNGTATAAFDVLPPPTVTGLSPTAICSDVPATQFDILGTGLSSASTVSVGGLAPDSLSANVDGTVLTATFNQGLAAGSYVVSVSNGAGCDATTTATLVVNPTPLVFFVNPPVTFDGITTQATIFASGLSGLPQAVSLVDASNNATQLQFASGGRNGRILATIPPKPTVVAGSYAVHVVSDQGCPSSLDGTLAVTDSLTLAVSSIDPAFASPTKPTAVTIAATDPAPAGEVQFESVPQVYLNPTNGGTAIELSAVTFASTKLLNAVVSGAAPGTYDVVVVNPSGAVGLLPAALTVTADEPPRVTSIAPASLDAGATSNVTIFGANFSTSTSPTVSLQCEDFATGAAVPAVGPFTVTTATTTTLDVSINATGITDGAVCIVTVTNADGASFNFSALSFKNPAQNLNPFRAAPSTLVQARRAPALAAGRPTDTSRFLYVAGGDSGATTGAFTSVEAAPVDGFGNIGTFSQQRNTLANAFVGGATTSSPRTEAGVARIDRFVYVVGGDNGAGATGTLLRAQILDPLQAPDFVDLDAELVDSGITSGQWIYRVSALFPNTDASNPGGESLPGDPFTVVLPALPAGKALSLTLSWAPVPGASGYRVYRTPTPGASVDQVELLAEINDGATTTHVDNGDATDPTVVPLPPGSLGVWHDVTSSPLPVPRAAHAVVAVPNPAASDEVFLYSVGGRTTGGTVVGTGEVATVTIAVDESQTVSAWRPLTASLATARAELAGLAITPADTTTASTKTFVFFTSGRKGNGQLSSSVDAAEVTGNGDIAAYTAVSTPNPERAGAGGLSANGFLFLFGGANGGASNNDVSSALLDATPTLGNWNALGAGSMLVPRLFPATATESAFIFIAGGTGSGGAVLNTVEQTVE